MRICRLRSFDEFNALRDRFDREYVEMSDLEEMVSAPHKSDFTLPAYSYAAGKVSALYVTKAKQAEPVNWRESMICPETGLNSRLRAAYQFFEMEFGPDQDANIYLSEQTTRFYSLMKVRYRNLTGSEYLGPEITGGFINDKYIRHEDLTNLSFEDASLDYCVSLECFEHIPNYEKGFACCARVLKKGGKLLLSVPFALHHAENIVRAVMNESNQVIHLLEPEYHLDPINPKGCLCFTHFGWQILNDLKKAGFSDAYVLLYWSKEFGYLGGHQAIIIAQK